MTTYPPAEDTMWAVKGVSFDKTHTYLMGETYGTRLEAIRAMEAAFGMKWAALYRRCYRAVRVRVTEVVTFHVKT